LLLRVLEPEQRMNLVRRARDRRPVVDERWRVDREARRDEPDGQRGDGDDRTGKGERSNVTDAGLLARSARRPLVRRLADRHERQAGAATRRHRAG
jgi:hypothetical protein